MTRLEDAEWNEAYTREEIARFRRRLVDKIDTAVDCDQLERAEALARVFALVSGSKVERVGEVKP